ncbi:hypothetical protein FEM48_Zijuj01G0231300 [Ziziphus jujuba var. spinosa]|uniref:Uncharacterized protein n=1 Tax=Ziziphus jujuba var. spinosa TaxID=714518 RepID=A0A978W434_ZIZJJ|nr:hypothetical protein FEM48_Zijuj01G0231300 [Ziziphus jujuba var. spinosa]
MFLNGYPAIPRSLFCPPDGAFFASKYPQPPLTLLQYQVVPLKLESGDLGSLPHGSKIDTLLLGHPLVVTTLQSEEYPSLNGVKVTEWNLYNDGGLIIHGVITSLICFPDPDISMHGGVGLGLYFVCCCKHKEDGYECIQQKEEVVDHVLDVKVVYA